MANRVQCVAKNRPDPAREAPRCKHGTSPSPIHTPRPMPVAWLSIWLGAIRAGFQPRLEAKVTRDDCHISTKLCKKLDTRLRQMFMGCTLIASFTLFTYILHFHFIRLPADQASMVGH